MSRLTCAEVVPISVADTIASPTRMNVTCVVKRAPSGAVSVASNSCDWRSSKRFKLSHTATDRHNRFVICANDRAGRCL